MLFFRFCPHWPGHRLQLPRDSNTSVYSATSYSSSAPAVSLCCPRFDYIRRRGILVRMHRGKSPPPGYPVGREGGGRKKRKKKKNPRNYSRCTFPTKKSGDLQKDPFRFYFSSPPRSYRSDVANNGSQTTFNFIKRGTIIDQRPFDRSVNYRLSMIQTTPLSWNVALGILSFFILSLSLPLSL